MRPPKKIYIDDPTGEFDNHWNICPNNNSIEYVPKDAFIEKAANYLNYLLYDRVEITKPGTIIPSLIIKCEFIEDFKNYLKGE